MSNVLKYTPKEGLPDTQATVNETEENLPPLFPFLPIPYPLPLSTPTTRAKENPAR